MNNRATQTVDDLPFSPRRFLFRLAAIANSILSIAAGVMVIVAVAVAVQIGEGLPR